MKIVELYQGAVKYFENQEAYAESVSRFLLLCLEVLSPTKIRDGKKTISGLFVAILASMIGICILSLTFIVTEYKCLSLTSLSENVGICTSVLRGVFYLIYIALVFNDISQLVQQLMNEKKAQKDEITFNHGKEEFIGILLLDISTTFVVLVTVISVIFFKVNENNLLFDFRLTFLHLESAGIEWTINYVLQVTLVLFTLLGFLTLFPIIFILINNSCWKIDQTILLLTNWNSEKSEDDASELIKNVVKKSCEFLGYLNETQRLLKGFFFIEILTPSISLCMNFFVILSDPPGNIVNFSLICVLFAQAFIVCWLGNRVIIRIDAFTAAIYDLKWYKFAPTDRRSLQILLTMSQNIRGYNGIFHEVNMETFQKILEFAYSYLMFMKSV